MTQTSGVDEIRSMLADNPVKLFLQSHLSRSLVGITGLSKELIDATIQLLDTHEFEEFINTYGKQLKKEFIFHSDIAPDFFEKHIIQEIPVDQLVLDVGCGPGSLLKRLRELRPSQRLKGIDVLRYSEWTSDIDFQVVSSTQFVDFLEKQNPFHAVLTWVLHHVDADQQVLFLSSLRANMGSGSKCIVLEDAYAELIEPEFGLTTHDEFMQLSKIQRQCVLSVHDWLANRILAQKSDMNIPFSFHTAEHWCQIAEQAGFIVDKVRYLGFPEKRDVDNPQTIIVLRAP